MRHARKLRVTFNGRKVGVLARDEKQRIWFEYDAEWVSAGFNLNPISMDFSTAPQLAPKPLFGGLHSVFQDSLPDGWGLLLMDREFKRRFDWSPRDITPIDRLAYIGSRAMGALEYQPVFDQEHVPDEVDLCNLAASVETVLQGETGEVLLQLRIQGGSPGGARPKVTVARSCKNPVCLSGFKALPPGFEHWMVKFRSSDDPRDMGRIEMAYADMAREAGIVMPPTELISVSGKRGQEDFFAVKRFDRTGAGSKVHVLSLACAIYADFRTPCLDYEGVLQATSVLTKDVVEVERAFRLMVFNVLAHNKDDHVKNFAFIYIEGERWKLSPAFDLTFSEGMGGEHLTAIAGHGNPELQHVLKLGREFHLKHTERIVDEVRHAVAQWPALAKKWKVCPKSAAEIQRALSMIDRRFAQAEKTPGQTRRPKP